MCEWPNGIKKDCLSTKCINSRMHPDNQGQKIGWPKKK